MISKVLNTVKRPPANIRQVFSTLFDSSQDAAFLIETSTRVVLASNVAAERLFGYSAAELVGDTTEKLFVDHVNFDRFSGVSEPAIQRGGVFHSEFMMRHRNGSIFKAVHCVVLVQGNGGYDAAFSVVRAAPGAGGDSVCPVDGDALRRTVTNAKSRVAALDAIIDAVRRAIGWEYAEAWFADARGNLVLATAAYDPAEDLARYHMISRVVAFGKGEGMPGRIWVSGQPEWFEISRNSSEQLFRRVFAATACGLRTVAGFPVAGHGKTAAVVILASARARYEDQCSFDVIRDAIEGIAPVLEGQFDQEPSAGITEAASLDDRLLTLSARERDVLSLLLQGMTSKEVARVLHISARTVDAHRRSILGKTKAGSVVKLISRFAASNY